MVDILALGELLIDFTPAGSSDRAIALYARNPGGAPANVLAMAAKLGAGTALIATASGAIPAMRTWRRSINLPKGERM